MIYVKNNMKYAVMFKAVKNNREVKFEFDCQRIYKDTGNIATTGVTPISEEDYKLLYETVKPFKNHIDKGYLEKTKTSGATSVANKMTALEKENETLKKQLEEKTKEASTATSEENKKLADENASLKAQLEALKKEKETKKKGSSKPAETEEGDKPSEKAEEAKVDENEGF